MALTLVTASEMRRLDEWTIHRHGTPGHVLMERAGRGATTVLLEQFPHVRRRRVVVVAGRGNNGGDGFVIARLLRRKGVRAEVALLGAAADVRGDAAHALRAMQAARVPLTEVTTAAAVGRLAEAVGTAALVVDAIFGTGLNATVQGLHADVLHLLNASGLPIFAVDIPSGLDADRGIALGVAVQAEATATFGFAKIGQVIHPGVDHVGALAVVDIGIAADAVADVLPRTALLQAPDVARLVPVRVPDTHKGSYGHVLVIAGSRGHTGAALLAAHAACRTGAGLTTLAGPASLNTIFSLGAPEVMTVSLADADGGVRFDETAVRRAMEGKTAVVVGPGIGTHDDAERLVAFLLQEAALPMVVDADALTCLARTPAALRRARAAAILTPHPGEMGRLLATDAAAVQADRVGTARTFAAAHGCTVVLKGARTVIAAADGAVWINPTGNPGMASGGMGDALSGMLGALLAQALPPAEAACLGVYLHGDIGDRVAADRGPFAVLASDIIEGVPAGFARLCAVGAGPASPGEPGRRRAGRTTGPGRAR